MESACGFHVYDSFLKICLKRLSSQLQNNTATFFSPSSIPTERGPNRWFCVFLSTLLSPNILRGEHLTLERTPGGRKHGGGPLWRKAKGTAARVTQ